MADKQKTAKLGEKYEVLRQRKEQSLKSLQKLKPGAKGYRGALKEFLEIDADLDRALMKRVNKQVDKGAESTVG